MLFIRPLAIWIISLGVLNVHECGVMSIVVSANKHSANTSRVFLPDNLCVLLMLSRSIKCTYDYGNRSHWNRDWSRWSRTYHVITTTTKTHQHTNCVSTHEYMRGNRKNTIAMCVNGHKRVISKHHLNGSTLHGNLSVVTHSPTTSSIYSVAMVSVVFERHPMQRFELPTTARKCRTYAPIKWLAAVIM